MLRSFTTQSPPHSVTSEVFSQLQSRKSSFLVSRGVFSTDVVYIAVYFKLSICMLMLYGFSYSML